jgi:prephenate dehydrogenase
MILGTGRMAKLLAKAFRGVAEVFLASPTQSEAKKLAKRLGVEWARVEDAGDHDFVVLAVPPLRLKEAASSIACHLKPRAVVMDISSVKKGFVEKVLEVLPSNAGYVSLHPLFGPSVRRIEGETVVVIPVRGEWALIKALELVKGSGLRAVVSSVEEHDRVMSIIQVAHHLSYLAYALTLTEAMDPQLIEGYATRSLRATLRMLKRMSKNFGVVREIQELNVYGRAAKVHLLESLKKLIEADEDTWSKVKTSLESLASLRLCRASEPLR